MKTNSKLYGKAAQQDVVVVENTAKSDKKASWEHIKRLFENMNLNDEDVAKTRKERFS